MEIATFLPTAAGQFYLLSYWLADGIGAFPSGYPTTFIRISHWLSAKTWQFPALFSEGPHFCKPF
jgi:hypothetical protein